MSAHSAEEIITVVTVRAPDRAAAVAIALAVVSEALKRPVAPSQPLNGMHGRGITRLPSTAGLACRE